MTTEPRDPYEIVREGWTYTREHFVSDPESFVGHIPTAEWDAALDALLDEVDALRRLRRADD